MVLLSASVPRFLASFDGLISASCGTPRSPAFRAVGTLGRVPSRGRRRHSVGVVLVDSECGFALTRRAGDCMWPDTLTL